MQDNESDDVSVTRATRAADDERHWLKAKGLCGLYAIHIVLNLIPSLAKLLWGGELEATQPWQSLVAIGLALMAFLVLLFGEWHFGTIKRSDIRPGRRSRIRYEMAKVEQLACLSVSTFATAKLFIEFPCAAFLINSYVNALVLACSAPTLRQFRAWVRSAQIQERGFM